MSPTTEASGSSFGSLIRNSVVRRRPLSLVIGGRTGTGKTTLALAIADALGAELLRTDVVRQEVFGAGFHPAEADGGIYRRAARDHVHDEMFRRAAAFLAGRTSVVLDGTFSTLDILDKAQELAADSRSVFLPVECVCRPDTAFERIGRRLAAGRDTSDARPEIHDIQRTCWESWPADVSQVRIDTEQPLNKQVEQIIAALAPAAAGRGECAPH